MTNRFFSFRLFKEGLRQSRLVGLIGLITVVAFTLLIAVGIIADDATYVHYQTYSFYTVSLVLIAQYCVFSPIMVLYLFRYLNRRDSSDFYHTIPHKREALHLSYFAAVEFWNVVTTLAVAVTVIGVYNLTPYATLQYTTMLPFLFNMLVAQFAVAASVLLAMSITGTGFSNLLVALMIIFIPRIITTSMASMIQNVCVVADIFEQVPLLDPALNIAAGLPITCVIAVFNGFGDPVRCLTDPICGLYTLGLGMITFAAAIFLLHRRKSETATKSSPARWLQAIYRIAFGAVLGLPAVAVLFNAIISDDIGDIGYWIGIFALLFGAILFYFLFELIATRKPKNLLTAIPGMFIFLAIDAVLLMTCFGLGHSILNFTPDADDLDYITISVEDENYFVANASKIHIEDSEAKAIAAECLQDTVYKVKQKVIGRHRYYGISYNYYLDGQGYTALRIGYNTAMGTQYRYVMLDSEQRQALTAAVETDQNYKDCFYDFPSEDAVVFASFAFGGDELSHDEAKTLYRSYVAEAKTLPFDSWYGTALYCHTDYGYSFTTRSDLGCVVLKPTRDGKEYNMTLNIFPELFPKTSRVLTDMVNRDCERQMADMKALLTSLQGKTLNNDDYSKEGEYLNMAIEPIVPNEYYLRGVDANDIHFVLTLLAQSEPFTWQEDHVAVGIAANYYNTAESKSERNYHVLVGIPYDVLEPYLVPTE